MKQKKDGNTSAKLSTVQLPKKITKNHICDFLRFFFLESSILICHMVCGNAVIGGLHTPCFPQPWHNTQGHTEGVDKQVGGASPRAGQHAAGSHLLDKGLHGGRGGGGVGLQVCRHHPGNQRSGHGSREGATPRGGASGMALVNVQCGPKLQETKTTGKNIAEKTMGIF